MPVSGPGALTVLSGSAGRVRKEAPGSGLCFSREHMAGPTGRNRGNWRPPRNHWTSHLHAEAHQVIWESQGEKGQFQWTQGPEKTEPEKAFLRLASKTSGGDRALAQAPKHLTKFRMCRVRENWEQTLLLSRNFKAVPDKMLFPGGPQKWKEMDQS